MNSKGHYLIPVPEYRARIYLPMETALAQHDEVISLLAALGAEVDVQIKSSTASHMQRLSLLQWTSKAVSILGSKTAPKPIQAPENLPDSPAGDTWSQYRAYLVAVVPHRKAEVLGPVLSSPRKVLRGTVYTQRDDCTSETKEYFTFAESVLRAHGATLPEAASTSEESATSGVGFQTHVLQSSGYLRQGRYTYSPVPVHLKVFYDELYEACWKGDNATIRELCLPKRVEEGKEPIQIVAQTTNLSDSVPGSGASLSAVCP